LPTSPAYLPRLDFSPPLLLPSFLNSSLLPAHSLPDSPKAGAASGVPIRPIERIPAAAVAAAAAAEGVRIHPPIYGYSAPSTAPAGSGGRRVVLDMRAASASAAAAAAAALGSPGTEGSRRRRPAAVLGGARHDAAAAVAAARAAAEAAAGGGGPRAVWSAGPLGPSVTLDSPGTAAAAGGGVVNARQAGGSPPRRGSQVCGARMHARPRTRKLSTRAHAHVTYSLNELADASMYVCMHACTCCLALHIQARSCNTLLQAVSI
jgi:hypothetical protein